MTHLLRIHPVNATHNFRSSKIILFSYQDIVAGQSREFYLICVSFRGFHQFVHVIYQIILVLLIIIMKKFVFN